MRVSEYYGLNRTQPTLDFVDVDVEGDTRIFLDPRALRLLPSSWGDECVSLVQDFFQSVLKGIAEGKHYQVRSLLRSLKEPNETHLGLSRTVARGRALGPSSATDIWKALTKSEALRSGLLEDLEDSILMVDGVSCDIISDITTNIIREPLIRYTNEMANYYGIPLSPDVNSGPLWDPSRKEWFTEFVKLPITDFGKLLFVPKVIVRKKTDYDVSEYYRHYILEELREQELSANTELVQLLRNGKRRVTKKDLQEKYGTGKSVIVRETQNFPGVLERYRRDKNRYSQPPLSHAALAESEGTQPPDWDALLRQLLAVKTGKEYFSQYENAIEQLLTAIFYPSLSNPQKQTELHDGRKRIDLTYSNVAQSGFFHWLGQHYPAAHIFIECKNYSRDIANPELDQLSGRFSPSRGKVGIITCRSFENKELFLERCCDTARDDRGYIIPLDDSDISDLVEEIQSAKCVPNTYALIQKQFHRLISIG